MNRSVADSITVCETVEVNCSNPKIVTINPEKMVRELYDHNVLKAGDKGDRDVEEGLLRTSLLPRQWIDSIGGLANIEYDASAFQELSIGQGHGKDRHFVGKPIVGRALRGDPRAMTRRQPVERHVVRLFVNFAFCSGTDRMEVMQRALDMAQFLDALRSTGHQCELYVLEFGCGSGCDPRVIMVQLPTNPLDLLGFLGMTAIRGIFHAFMHIDQDGKVRGIATMELAFEGQRRRLRKVLGDSPTDYIINMPFNYKKGWLLDQLKKSQREVGVDPLGLLKDDEDTYQG